MNTVVIVAFLATVWYLIEFYSFALSFKRNNPEAWKEIGSPEIFGIEGQYKYLGMALGRPNRIPPAITNGYRKKFLRIRILLVVALLSYGALFFYTGF